ncbi:hypothetical protein Pstr01_07760 [Pseudomonas straminea]|uniref:sugar 3,4-ketoisomerase n=1 Tax=Pseudomonas straminea TaxID=47882 RepID=UPI000B875EB2|nr:hypothetical protein Pstr01_07760 [Pseudomonas straminea]
MASLISLPTYSDARGSLSVVEDALPFEVRRVYFVYDVVGARGGHRHKRTRQALVCVSGTCDIYVNNGRSELTYKLATPTDCLVLEPEDWHTMHSFTKAATLLVFASERYDKSDYIDEKYP